MTESIILTGFMGCGKTTLGKALSAIAGIPHCDSDSVIEKELECTLGHFVLNNGEYSLRLMEKTFCKELSTRDPCVLSTGGGMILDEENYKNLSKIGLIVFIDIPLSVIVERVRGTIDRPLIEDEKKIRALWDERYDTYQDRCNIHMMPKPGSDDIQVEDIWEEVKYNLIID